MARKGQRFLTLATKNDWAPILSSLEAMLPVKYVESGMFAHGNAKEYPSFRSLPNLGDATSGDAVQQRRYLVMKRNTPIYSRVVSLNTGDTRYVIDHDNNPESVVFSAGGVLQKPRAVVQGEVSKLSTLAATEEIFQTLAKLIKKHFRSIKAYRVGSEALSLGREGYRLTASIESPTEYDLAV